MAERRMFAKAIIDSDVFLDMPLSTQALYFHLAMRADDDGFVGNPKKIQKMIGASDDDCKLLVMKRYILTFDSGIIVIKHWKIHNYIQTDRYKATTYIEEKASLKLDEKKSYTECIQNVSKMYPQVSIGKDSIDKVSIGKETISDVPETDTPQKQEIFIKLILIDNTFYELPEDIVKQYEDLYKGIDVRQEIRNAQAWLLSNPNKRKTKRGILRYINGWLERKQNSYSGGSKPKNMEAVTPSTQTQKSYGR